MSYFVWKHVSEGSLTSIDLKNISKVLNYDLVSKELDEKGNINGYIFIKKTEDREGYFDIIVKKLFNDEEIFHYQYCSSKNTNRLINKRRELGIIMDSKH